METLPDILVSKIASDAILNGVGGLALCATCKAFRAVQPPLRRLRIDYDFDYGIYGRKFADDATDYELEIALDLEEGYKLLESISPRHAAEITHLSVCHLWDGRDILNHPQRPYGTQFTALRVLYLEHPCGGWRGENADYGEPGTDQNNTLRACTTTLIRNTAATLHVLHLVMPVYFYTDDMITLIPYFGESLQQLDVNLIPFNGGIYTQGRGFEEDTRRLQNAVQERFPMVVGRIVCHKIPDPAVLAMFRAASSSTNMHTVV